MLRITFKLAFDVILAAAALTVLSPVLLLISILIKVTSAGPVFYVAERVGQNGRTFKMLKFRSMHVGADKNGVSSTSDNDPRITRLGSHIRKYKIDELPQLFNVLKREMAIVGPRPEVKKIVQEYSKEDREVLTVRPGIIDYGTLWNSDEGRILANSEKPDEDYVKYILPTKIALSRNYVQTYNLIIDGKIVFAYALSVLFGLNSSWALPKSDVRVPDYHVIKTVIDHSNNQKS